MSTTSARQPITTSAPYVTSVAACRWMMLKSWRPLWCLQDLTTVTLFSLEHHSLILTNCNGFKMLLLARSSQLHWLPVAVRTDLKIAVITFNLLIAEQRSTYVNCSSCINRRNRLGQAVTTYWTFHDHTLHLYSRVFPTLPLPLVSGIHSLIQSLMIWTSLHQSLNPDLKHSSTERPISIINHSVTLTAPAIRLIGRHIVCS